MQSNSPEKLGLVVHNEPAHAPHLRQRHAVADGQEILPGQVISVLKNTAKNRLEFIRGFDVKLSASSSDEKLSIGDLLYVARQASTDGDVLNSGKLTGLSSVGGFELSTSHFDASKSYNIGDYLVPDGLTGNLIPIPSVTSEFTENALDGDIVTFAIARVVKDYDPPVDFSPVYTPAPGEDASVSPGVRGETFEVGRRFGANDLRMLRIELVPPREVTVANG